MLKRLKGSDRYHYETRQRRQLLWRVVLIPLSIVALLGGVAFGYTWYQGQQTEVIEEEIERPVTNKPPSAPTAPPKNAKVSISVASFTSPVKAGQNSSISIKTLPEAACTITYTYNPTKRVSKDSGLIPKTADEFGVVSWTWTVTTDTRAGAWPVEVTCAYNGSSAYSKSDLVVK